VLEIVAEAWTLIRVASTLMALVESISADWRVLVDGTATSELSELMPAMPPALA
jgi:hypothetical protein